MRLHGQVGDALERRWEADPDRHAAELAAHFAEAATLSTAHARRAVHYGRHAAEQAEAVAGWDEARRHYQRCLDLLTEVDDVLDSSFDADRADLLVSLGRCARDAGDARAGWRALMEAIDLYKERADGPALARATLEALHVYASPQRAAQLVRDAVDGLAGAEPRLEALLLVELASTALGSDLRTAAERERLNTLVAAHEWPDVAASILLQDTFRAVESGTLGIDEAAARLHDAHELLDQLGETGQAVLALSAWGGAVMGTGDIDAALAACDELAEYARSNGARYLEEPIFSYRMMLLLERCDWGTIDRLRAHHEEQWPGSHQSRVIDGLRRWMAGRLDDALATYPSIPDNIPAFGVMDLCRRTELLFVAGRTDEVADEFARLRPFLELGNVTFQQTALAYLGAHLVELADETLLAAFDELVRHHDALEDAPVHSFGSIQLSFATYELARGRGDDVERRYREALAWARRERCPIDEGRSLLGLADLAERCGDHPAALDHLEAAGAIFAEHGLTYYLDQVLAKKEILKA